MDGSGLLAVDQLRRARVGGELDRVFSLAKDRAAAFVPEQVRLANSVPGRVR